MVNRFDLNVNPAPEASIDMHTVKRGRILSEHEVPEGVSGYNPELMRGRALLSPAEEKKLMRKVDLHLMPLLALILMVKNLDANNVSYRPFVAHARMTLTKLDLDLPNQAANARIMNKGTPRNILEELHMSSDAYNFVSSIYFVSAFSATVA